MKKKEEKDFRRLHGQLVIDFVNSETSEEAINGYFRNLERIFGFLNNFVKSAKDSFPDDGRKIVGQFQKEFRRILEYISQHGKLYGDLTIKKLLWTYNTSARPFIDKVLCVLPDDSFAEVNRDGMEQDFINRSDTLWINLFQLSLTYCLIEFLKYNKGKDYIKKCFHCHGFFIAKILRKNNNFCSRKCQQAAYHSQKEVKEKKAKAKRDLHGWKRRVNEE